MWDSSFEHLSAALLDKDAFAGTLADLTQQCNIMHMGRGDPLVRYNGGVGLHANGGVAGRSKALRGHACVAQICRKQSTRAV